VSSGRLSDFVIDSEEENVLEGKYTAREHIYLAAGSNTNGFWIVWYLSFTSSLH
jgi:hypothetical protein